MRILELQVGRDGPARAHTARVLRAYLAAQRARASRRLLCVAIPALTLLLLVLQAATGVLTRNSVVALGGLSTAMAGAAGFRDWRATRELLQLIDGSNAGARARRHAPCDG